MWEKHCETCTGKLQGTLLLFQNLLPKSFAIDRQIKEPESQSSISMQRRSVVESWEGTPSMKISNQMLNGFISIITTDARDGCLIQAT